MGTLRSVAIIGHGLIGGSIELAVRAADPGVEVVTLDRGDDLQRTFAADLVVLATPVTANIDLLVELAGISAPHTLLTDTGSTKSAIVQAAAGTRFIGGHPVAGAAASGREAARADLFSGRPWILTPAASTRPADLARMEQFVRSLGARPTVLTADEHDRLFAFVSHLPQLAISALMDVAGRSVGAEGLALAGAGLRDSTRLAASPPDIWRDIVATNRPEIAAALDALIGALLRLRDDESGEALTTTFESAARWKQALGP